MSGKKHLSRLAAPNTWPIERKKSKWIAKPSPGTHKLQNCLPLTVVLRDILKCVQDKREVKYILYKDEVLINKIARRDYNFPVGIFDILEIPKLDAHYLILFDKRGKLLIIPIKKEDTKIKLSKIIGKTTIKGGKTQINLFDGNNYILDKDSYKVGDSLVIDLDSKKIKSHLPLETGSLIYLLGGSKMGYIGKVKEIVNKKNLHKPKIVYELDGETHETLKDYAFVIGKEKSLLPIKE